MTTNILLLIIIALLGLFFAWQIFNYFKGFKQRFFNTGMQTGINNTMRAIIEKAKQGKSFNLKDSKDEVKLIMLTKKNAKSISRGLKRPR